MKVRVIGEVVVIVGVKRHQKIILTKINSRGVGVESDSMKIVNILVDIFEIDGNIANKIKR